MVTCQEDNIRISFMIVSVLTCFTHYFVVVSFGYDTYPEGSGVTPEGSVDDDTDDTEGSSVSGSGSGDGSDGDDESYTNTPNRGRGNRNKNKKENEDHGFNFVDPTYKVDGSQNERTHVVRPPVQKPRQPDNSATTLSTISASCVTLLLITVKICLNILI